MRGTRPVHVGGLLLGGIIPADAGNTVAQVRLHVHLQDHPRGCGEHELKPATLHLIPGSSPRMRGTPKGSVRSVGEERIIPADAGNTWTRSAYSNPHGDHPRGCGEHSTSQAIVNLAIGSSPRMRGTHKTIVSRILALRIIPADAGNTYAKGRSLPSVSDHPRGCGEHGRSVVALFSHAGSSPRMRGALMLPASWSTWRRIIPADAGSTHWCSWACTVQCGSSPRMRGALNILGRFVAHAGIIPADAGSTVQGDAWLASVGDHPRGCGEHTEA